MEEIIYNYPVGHEQHAQYGHPERPERVEAIVSALKAENLWDNYTKVSAENEPFDIIESVHSKEYLHNLKEICAQGESLDMDTYTTPASWEIAVNTAFGTIALAERVWEQTSHRGFALTRPPGHHATRRRGMGFCLLNNAAIAAEFLIQTKGVKRLAILDFDLHHGNGTQDIFWKRGDVFYISTHQSPLYPGSGSLYEMGEGDGEGTTANFPLPPGSGDDAFRSVVEIIINLLDRYHPEMLIISYGFDPHWKDPLGHLQLSAGVYGEMIKTLSHWADKYCDGKVLLVLEGGYDLDAAKSCSVAVVSALLGRGIFDGLGSSPRPEGKSWERMVDEAAKIWNL